MLLQAPILQQLLLSDVVASFALARAHAQQDNGHGLANEVRWATHVFLCDQGELHVVNSTLRLQATISYQVRHASVLSRDVPSAKRVELFCRAC